jgi:hypothetical protein
VSIPSGAHYRVGGVDFAIVNDGTYWYDAGAIFGVVPRVMWERVQRTLDDRYRMPLGLNCRATATTPRPPRRVRSSRRSPRSASRRTMSTSS